MTHPNRPMSAMITPFAINDGLGPLRGAGSSEGLGTLDRESLKRFTLNSGSGRILTDESSLLLVKLFTPFRDYLSHAETLDTFYDRVKEHPGCNSTIVELAACVVSSNRSVPGSKSSVYQCINALVERLVRSVILQTIGHVQNVDFRITPHTKIGIHDIYVTLYTNPSMFQMFQPQLPPKSMVIFVSKLSIEDPYFQMYASRGRPLTKNQIESLLKLHTPGYSHQAVVFEALCSVLEFTSIALRVADPIYYGHLMSLFPNTCIDGDLRVRFETGLLMTICRRLTKIANPQTKRITYQNLCDAILDNPEFPILGALMFVSVENPPPVRGSPIVKMPQSPPRLRILNTPQSPPKKANFKIPQVPIVKIPQSPPRLPVMPQSPPTMGSFKMPQSPPKTGNFKMPQSPPKTGNFKMPQSLPKTGNFKMPQEARREASPQSPPRIASPRTPPRVASPQSPPRIASPQSPPRVASPRSPPRVATPPCPLLVATPQSPPRVVSPQIRDFNRGSQSDMRVFPNGIPPKAPLVRSPHYARARQSSPSSPGAQRDIGFGSGLMESPDPKFEYPSDADVPLYAEKSDSYELRDFDGILPGSARRMTPHLVEGVSPTGDGWSWPRTITSYPTSRTRSPVTLNDIDMQEY